MITFQYARANDVRDAVNRIADDPNAKFVAGGTNLIDLMKMDVERPTKVIDITRLPLKQVENMPNGGLRIAALVATPISPITLSSNSAIRFSPARSWPVPRNNSATWHRRAATSCSVRAAITSTT
jgi:hypothetical protein